MNLTPGTLLGGKVAYSQPATGHYRTGIEPVLLAAWVAARPGERVLEAGTGAGAGLLCLWRRVPGIAGTGLELDGSLVALARANAAANGAAALEFLRADVAAWRCVAGAFDHAFSNPPWHAGDSTPSPQPPKRRAKQAPSGLLASWVGALAAGLRHRGTLTLALPASSLVEAMAALHAARLGSISLLPLWPKAQRPAKLMLLRAIRGGRGGSRLLRGLTLHAADGRYTAEAEAVLRDGQTLGDGQTLDG